MICLLLVFMLVCSPVHATQEYTTDGCTVVESDGQARVTNPDQCPDKDFVRYLNCYDQYIKPITERPKECR